MQVQLEDNVVLVSEGRLAAVANVRGVRPRLVSARPVAILAQESGPGRAAAAAAGGSVSGGDSDEDSADAAYTEDEEEGEEEWGSGESTLAQEEVQEEEEAEEGYGGLGEEGRQEESAGGEEGPRASTLGDPNNLVTLWGYGLGGSQAVVVCRQGGES